MQRRRLLATAGAVTITAFATTVGLGANFGLFGVTEPDSPVGRLDSRRATVEAPRHPRGGAGHHDPAGRRRRRLILSTTTTRCVKPEPGQDVHQVGAELLLDPHRLPGDRVRERQSPGVEERAVEHQHRTAPPVGGVADDRVPDRLQVHADLVGPARSPAGTRAATPPGRGTRRRPRTRCGRSDHPPAPPCASGGAPSGRWARRSHRAPTPACPTRARRSAVRRRGRRASPPARRTPAPTAPPRAGRSCRGRAGGRCPGARGRRRRRAPGSAPGGRSPTCRRGDRRRGAPPGPRAWRRPRRRRPRTARRPGPTGRVAGAPGAAGSASTSITSSASSRRLLATRSPSTSTEPASTSACTSLRVQPVSSATARSTRSPASASGTANSSATGVNHARRVARSGRCAPPRSR